MKLTRLFTTTALATGAALVVSLGAAVPATASAKHDRNVEHAQAAYAAMQQYLYTVDGSSLYLERTVPTEEDQKYSYEWPFSQAHVATLDLTGIPGRVGRSFTDDLADRKVGQERYWNAGGGSTGLPGYDSYVRPPRGQGGDMFYDDNEWVALAKVQEYLATGDTAALNRAKRLFDLVASGWDTDASHAAPGGVFWTQAPWSQDRNTVSTMPGAELATRLYLITKKKSYLDWAQRSVAWTDKHLLAPNGLYWDHIGLDGTIEKTQWSYNQGVSLGAHALLYQATGDRAYLKQAKAIASKSLAFYAQDGRLERQPMFFNSIYFKNLLLLESITGGHVYRDAMQAYADNQWADVRDPATDLFPVDGAPTTLLDQAAMTQIYATLAWPRGKASILY
ncbi:glycoside hydrolase family 76 protein [Cellulomonas edaphi]|uniref:Glycoside hydrolase family 76 protein n=1 Tax=Cellulomonas edaphi TaxID=3053468 RepID=A0ABT7S392_9CELL|nr:glycoside hydrolase family 76 protein [Cellulomons edaphi]MDM7830085.1 glycoside hydrolase family 76 protein [Cellulomons edaphi]